MAGENGIDPGDAAMQEGDDAVGLTCLQLLTTMLNANIVSHFKAVPLIFPRVWSSQRVPCSLPSRQDANCVETLIRGLPRTT